jgi:dephospho-CoA kinase
MKKRIGITGGIGSGKTTVCEIFESLGIPVYYADTEAKKIMVSHHVVKKKIIEILGAEAYHNNGKPNRPYIASKIFADKQLLNSVNGVVHPAVQADSDRWFEKAIENAPYAIKEAALLVENGSYRHMDALIVVTCPEDIRIDRVMKRDHLPREKVVKKLQNQLPESDKIAVADYIIVNDGEHALIPQIIEIHHKLTHHK